MEISARDITRLNEADVEEIKKELLYVTSLLKNTGFEDILQLSGTFKNLSPQNARETYGKIKLFCTSHEAR